MTRQQELVQTFEHLYGGGGNIRLFFAPGRVNLIGDHTDYNGGHTFPCALKLGFTAAVRLRSDQQVCLSSMLLDPGTVFRYDLHSQNEISQRRASFDWVRTFLDMIRVFEEKGYMIPTGFEMLINGEIPTGTGLGVAGAMEALIAVTLRGLYEYKDIGNRELLDFCRKIDGIYTGVNSGVIRTCASLMGREGYGLFISSQKMQYEFVPLEMKNAVFLMTDSRIRQKLTREIFFQRRSECEKALKKLQVVANIDDLCSLSTDRFESCKDVIMEPTYTKRARHVVYEDSRTVRAVSALKAGNPVRFGMLMNQSHESLKNNYEVSGPETDFIQEQACKIEGVYGSRITGVGKGGFVLTLLERDAVPAFKERIHHEYHSSFGLHPVFLDVEAGDGAREMTEQI
ncbi:MAG: galactokinase [Blautia sp.]|nr:galactokinase [Blautia sp.]